MNAAVILSGFGGQGLLFAGTVLAQAALDEGREVAWLPSYGPEMRGGTASCTVTIADGPIGSPIVDAADIVVALTPPALARYEKLVAPRGLLVVNDTLIEAEVGRADIDVVRAALSALARDAGDERAVTIGALGAALARRPVVRPDSVRSALRRTAGRIGDEAVARNLRAFDAGLGAVALTPA